jgi:Uma2 family endonuclease
MADGAPHQTNLPTATAEGPWRELRLTVRDYDRMAEAGLFHEPGRFELWDRRIMVAPQPGGRHMAAERGAVERLTLALFGAGLLDRFKVQTGGGIEIGAHKLRGPDVMILKAPVDNVRRPTGDDVALVIEIAPSSLTDDLTQKREKYAAAGVPEYWVLDVEGRRLVVFRGPRAGYYPAPEVLETGAVVNPLFAPQLSFAIDDLV